jgi:hypothetical protein
MSTLGRGLGARPDLTPRVDQLDDLQARCGELLAEPLDVVLDVVPRVAEVGQPDLLAQRHRPVAGVDGHPQQEPARRGLVDDSPQQLDAPFDVLEHVREHDDVEAAVRDALDDVSLVEVQTLVREVRPGEGEVVRVVVDSDDRGPSTHG